MFSGGHSDDVDYMSWNPTHPDLFCTSSQKDRKIVFWDARRTLRLSFHLECRYKQTLETRCTQQCPLKVSPTQTNYAPDGKSLLYTSAAHQVFFLTLGNTSEGRSSWGHSDKDPVRAWNACTLTGFTHRLT